MARSCCFCFFLVMTRPWNTGLFLPMVRGVSDYIPVSKRNGDTRHSTYCFCCPWSKSSGDQETKGVWERGRRSNFTGTPPAKRPSHPLFMPLPLCCLCSNYTLRSPFELKAAITHHTRNFLSLSLFLPLFTQMIARRVWMAASTAVRGRRNASTVALQDLKTRWPAMSTTEQNTIAKELEEVQKQDWNVMSTEDKKAACTL